MEDQTPDSKARLQPVPPSLKSAIRRVRMDEAERSGVMSELRGAEIARLEMLAESLEAVFSQVPDHIDIFDAGVVPGERPRLYIDMIAFVEMAADKRTYRLIQSTRHGRVTAATSEKIPVVVEAITTYIARRLVEREQSLAADRTVEAAAQDLAARHEAALRTAQPPQPVPRRMRRLWNGFVETIVFIAELIGFTVLLTALFAALYFGWTFAEAWWTANLL